MVGRELLDKETCPHEGDIFYGYFMKDGIERRGQYCDDCRQLLDYIPQYNED